MPRTTGTVTAVVGKAGQELSDCLYCKDVEYKTKDDHKCLKFNELTQKWEVSEPDKCPILQQIASKIDKKPKLGLDFDNGYCDEIPYLDTDPREDPWGPGDPTEPVPEGFFPSVRSGYFTIHWLIFHDLFRLSGGNGRGCNWEHNSR